MFPPDPVGLHLLFPTMAPIILHTPFLYPLCTMSHVPISTHLLPQDVDKFVTYRPVARQGLGKHIPAEAHTSNNRTPIARQWISKQAFSTTQRMFFLHGRCRDVIKGQRRSFELVVENWVEFWRRQSKVIEKNKWIRLCKEAFRCDLKLHWDGYESVARIRLVKTENPSACVTVNWKCVD
jgi:hypothetical protein